MSVSVSGTGGRGRGLDDVDQVADEDEDAAGTEAEAGDGEDAVSSVTSMPAMSCRPTPKNRESFAARMRRMRNSGSDGLVSDALFGPDSGEGASIGEIGGERDAGEGLPQWNMLRKGGGLACPWKDMRTGYFSGVAECCDRATDWGMDTVDAVTLLTDCWLGEECGRPSGEAGRKSVGSVFKPFLEGR